MLLKDKVLKTIEKLPDNFTLEEVFEQLIILHKVEIGLQQVQEGKTMTTEELKTRLKRWQK